jgi:hypothetical protein
MNIEKTQFFGIFLLKLNTNPKANYLLVTKVYTAAAPKTINTVEPAQNN